MSGPGDDDQDYPDDPNLQALLEFREERECDHAASQKIEQSIRDGRDEDGCWGDD